MKSKVFKPALFIKKGGALSLSEPALSELLQAMIKKKVPFRFRAKGFSMSPFIRDGDIITVCSLSNASPGLGDIVAFINPSTRKLIVHRIVRKSNNSYLIKGDNSPELGDLIHKEDILGCVNNIERGGKDIFLGLGPERFLIAFLTRRRLLSPLLFLVRRLVPSVMRRSTK